MKTELELTLRLRSPIALHRTRASIQYVKTLDYIPGIAVRGALAEVYLSERGEPDDDTFQRLFVFRSGAVRRPVANTAIKLGTPLHSHPRNRPSV